MHPTTPLQAPRARLRALAVLVIVALTALGASQPAEALDRHGNGAIRHELERRINLARQSHGLRPLVVGPVIQRGARDHSCRMALRGQIYHDPALRYHLPASKRAWAENVGRTTARAAAWSLHSAFMRSSRHRATILNPRYDRMGLGICRVGSYTYVVQRFVDF